MCQLLCHYETRVRAHGTILLLNRTRNGDPGIALEPLEPDCLMILLECVGESISLSSDVQAEPVRTTYLVPPGSLVVGKTQVVPFGILCAEDAVPFSMLALRVMIYLRSEPGSVTINRDAPGLVIQQWTILVKPSLSYAPKEQPGDVLLFAGGHMDGHEIAAWTKILDGLGLSFDIWDVVSSSSLVHLVNVYL